MTARIIVCVLLAAACSEEQPPSPLDQSKIDYALARMTQPGTLEPVKLYTDPDRAYIHDIVEGQVILKSVALTFCLAEYRGVDAIVVAKVVPSGATWLSVLTRDHHSEAKPTVDGKATECFRKELGAKPFPGIKKDSLGGFDYAVVAFRPLLLGRR